MTSALHVVTPVGGCFVSGALRNPMPGSATDLTARYTAASYVSTGTEANINQMIAVRKDAIS